MSYRYTDLEKHSPLADSILIAWVILGFLLLAISARAAEPPKFEPKPEQKLKLENAQLRRQIIFQNAQAAADKAQKELLDTCQEVITANKWPEGTYCEPSDPQNVLSPLVFKTPKVKPAEPKANEERKQ